MAGYRVLRGPNWEGCNADGGEGHLGTITELLCDGRVRVLWDTGQETTCRAGSDGKFELRIFDTAQSGVRHPNTACQECGEKNIYGALWRCKVCTGCDLCSRCYSEDKHDIRHKFVRIDCFTSSGTEVKQRKTSVKMRAMGIFPGSKVTRGKNWIWEDQDGGKGSQGKVEDFENLAPDSARNLVRVLWPNGLANSYRLGFEGQVDLTCVEEEIGSFYYRDHLLLADSSNLPLPLAPVEDYTCSSTSGTSTDVSVSSPVSTTTSVAVPTTASSSPLQTSQPVTNVGSLPNTALTGGNQMPRGEVSQAVVPDDVIEEDEVLLTGDKVVIAVDAHRLTSLQEKFGGCTQGMIRRIGVEGVVTALPSEQTPAITVKYTERQSYRLNPAVLVKVTAFTQGDVVRLRRDVKQVKFLNARLGWKEEMGKACGKVGRVSGVACNGDVTVWLSGQELTFTASCLLPALGAPLDDARAGKEPDRNAVADLAGMFRNITGRAGNDSGSSADILTHLLRLTEGGGSSSDRENSDPRVRQLFLTIRAGDRLAVRRMVSDDRGLLTAIHKNLTPLGYASHTGMIDVMDTLVVLGADINCRDGKKRTPLMSAIEGTEQQAALHLIENGADVNIPNRKQQTPLHFAAIRDMAEVIHRLVFSGADVNAMDSFGDTPLFDAINQGKEQAVEALLQVPTLNKYAMNSKGFNILHLACLKGRPRALELILELQDRPHVDDRLHGEYTALHIAANNDHVECVGLLILLGGATIDLGDGRRQLTPLHLASKEGEFLSAQCLIEMGANVNATDVYGNTPLHLALGKSVEDERETAGISRDQSADMCIRLSRLLIDSGATVDAMDYSGRTPMDYGQSSVRRAIQQYIDERRDAVLSYSITDVAPALTSDPSPITGDSGDSGAADLTLPTPESKEHDAALLQGLIKGVRLQCATSDMTPDVTLQPCGHKSVCRKCSDAVTRCPACAADVQDGELDKTDDDNKNDEKSD